MPTGRDEVGDKNSPRRGEVRSWKERVSAKHTHDRREEGERERKRERERSRGQSADHVGAAPTVRMATCQITHLARVNNYSETRVIALHYAYISHRPLRRVRSALLPRNPSRAGNLSPLLPFHPPFRALRFPSRKVGKRSENRIVFSAPTKIYR